MAAIDKTYHTLLEKILKEGYWYNDPKRKGVKRLEIPSYTFRHELIHGFPILTTKKINYHNVITELLWFLKGDTNIKYLLDNNCNIWNKDAYNYLIKNYPYSEGETPSYKEVFNNYKNWNLNLGPIYGHQWRNFNGIDQISNLIKNLREQPLATDHIVNSWNVGDLKDMALPPCHDYFQILVKPLSLLEKVQEYRKLETSRGKDKPNFKEFPKALNENLIIRYGFELHWHQRSVDTFLGLPYNIASYATLALIIEKLTGYKALAIQGDLKKVHLYDNSIKGVKEQLSRDSEKYIFNDLEFNNPSYKSSTDWTKLDMDAFLDELYPEYFQIPYYESYPHIKVEMLERNETDSN